MIELVTTWDAIVNALGAAAMLAFGVWVLTLTPRTRSTKMLAVFALAAGAAYVPQNLVTATGWHRSALYDPYLGAVLLLGGLALLGLVREILAPLEGRSRRLWRIAVAVPATVVVLSKLIPPIVDPSLLGELTWQQATFTFGYTIGLEVFHGAALALTAVLALRYRHPPTDRAETVRTRAVLVSAALVIWPAFYAGRNVGLMASVPTVGVGFTVPAALLFGGFLLVAGLWLVNAHAVADRSEEGRNLALLTLGVMLAGVLQGAFVRPLFPPETSGPLWGVVRLATVVLLGYAILRHEILGVDAKFRWGVSKTTVAGVFVAVFFIVSEGAQVLFAGFANNEILGVVAAGALLFALSPIQRAADRIAERAVPGDGRGPGEGRNRSHRLYRSTVERFLADGEITDEEEQELADLAEEMGLGAGEAMRIRREVEDETEGGDTS